MFPNSSNLFFRSGDIAFLTKHQKEAIIAPLLEPFLGVRVRRVDGFDTDLFGTFTRDIKRVDSQLDTARKKACKGMELAKTRMGIGSEGSFSMDPYYGLAPWNVEMLVFVDESHGLEIVGVAEGPAKVLQTSCRSTEDIVLIAKEFGFPEDHMILRPDTVDNPVIIKNISTIEQLECEARRCFDLSKNGIVHIENDLRAFACPSRQGMIKLAAMNLLLKMHSLCPACNTPGYWVTENKKGLPCVSCRFPTDVLRAQVFSCRKCGFSKEILRTDLEFADQGSCNFCNP